MKIILRTQQTSDAERGSEAYPTWGPDGESVYFVSDGAQSQRNLGIWKVPVDFRTRCKGTER